MIKTFTQNELIRYVYGELDGHAKALLEATLNVDPQLAEECSDLLMAKAGLEGVVESPSEKVLSAILSYSRNLSLQLK